MMSEFGETNEKIGVLIAGAYVLGLGYAKTGAAEYVM